MNFKKLKEKKIILKLIAYAVITNLVCPNAALGKETVSDTAKTIKRACLRPPSMFSDRTSDNPDKALAESLERTLNNKPDEFGSDFDNFINKGNGNFEAFIDLFFREARIFIGEWRKGKYPSINESELDGIIEKILNKWMGYFSYRGRELWKSKRAPITTHFSCWQDSGRVKGHIIKDGECHISFTILNREMELIIPIQEGQKETCRKEESSLAINTYDSVIIDKLKDLKGENNLISIINNSECRTCIQNMINGLGWEILIQVLFRYKDILETNEEEITKFLEEIRKEIIKDAGGFLKSKDISALIKKNKKTLDPIFGSLDFNNELEKNWREWKTKHKKSLHINNSGLAYMLGGLKKPEDLLLLKFERSVFKSAYPQEYSEDLALSICMTKTFGSDLAEEVIVVLNEISEKLPKLGDTLVKNLIKRINEGKVFFGRNFKKAAVSAEFNIEGQPEHCIVLNYYLQSGLYADPAKINKRTLRGVFLASILLGQETQIYLRESKKSDWDAPEFNPAFIAQSAEFQALMLFRSIDGFTESYDSFINALGTNCPGELNYREAQYMHSGFVNRGYDYRFLEARVDTILFYQYFLTALAKLPYSKESLQKADIGEITKLFLKLGMGPILDFENISPFKGNKVEIRYPEKFQKTNMINEDELIKCVKETFLAVFEDQVFCTDTINDYLEKDEFVKLIIEVSPKTGKVSATIDLRNMFLIVKVPVVAEAGSWAGYCEASKDDSGKEVPSVEADNYKELLDELAESDQIRLETAKLIKEKNPKMAIRILQDKLKDYSYSLYIRMCLADIYLYYEKDYTKAFKILSEILGDHRIFLSDRYELLSKALGATLDTLYYINAPNVISDATHLVGIARKQLDKILVLIGNEIITNRERVDRAARIIRSVNLRGDEIKIRSGELSSGILINLRKREQNIRANFDSICAKCISLCDLNCSYLDIDKLIEWSCSSPEDKEYIFLRKKMYLSFVGGEVLKKDEESRIFEIIEERLKKNPMDYYNFAVWGNHLYMLWKYKYPDNKKYLQEAEKRYKQYIAFFSVAAKNETSGYYYLALIEHHLGKTNEFRDYFETFLRSSPEEVKDNLEIRECWDLYKSIVGKENTYTTKEQTGYSEIQKPILDDLIQNFLQPFIESGFSGISPAEQEQDKINAKTIYLILLYKTKQLEKAFGLVRKWLEEEPSENLDLVNELVKIAVQFNEEDKINEFLQRVFSAFREKDIILSYARALIFVEKKELLPALNILNSIINEYGPAFKGTKDILKARIMIEILLLRTKVYKELGNITRAKEDWQYVLSTGWRSKTICEAQIKILDQIDYHCKHIASEIYKNVDVLYDLNTSILKLNEIIADYPHNRHALYARAALKILQGKFDEVEKEYLSLLEIYPDDPGFLNDLAFFYHTLNNSKALYYYERYLDAGGDIKVIRDKLPKAYFLAGKWEEALTHMESYIDSLPVSKDGIKNVSIDDNILLLTLYIKLRKWDKAFIELETGFTKEDSAGKTEGARKNVVGLALKCCYWLIAHDEPDWGRIERIKDIALTWAKGLKIDERFKALDAIIKERKGEISAEEGVTKARIVINKLKRRIKNARKKINRLKGIVIKRDDIEKLKTEIREIMSAVDSEVNGISHDDESIIREQLSILDQLKAIEKDLPEALKTAEKRALEREEQIAKLAQTLRGWTEDVLNGKTKEEDDMEKLIGDIRKLRAEEDENISQLLEDLETAKRLAAEEQKRRKKEDRLSQLNLKFDTTAAEIDMLIIQLRGLLPGQDFDAILKRYRELLCDSLGIERTANLEDALIEKGLPQEFIHRVVSLDNYFMGIYSQIKGRKKLELKEAFNAEIETALKEMENIPVPSDGSIIEKYREIHGKLMAPVYTVLQKYEGLPGFKISYSERRTTIELAEDTIASIIVKTELAGFESDMQKAAVRQIEEEKSIEKFIARRNIINQAVKEWGEMIEIEKRKLKQEGEGLDFEAIKEKGKELARRLAEEKGIFLTYEEAFFMQKRVMEVLKPKKYGWKNVYPLVQVISMSKKDRQRALTEVHKCFALPKIDGIDKKIYGILNNKNPPGRIIEYMNNPGPEVKKLMDEKNLPKCPVSRFWAYWETANDNVLNQRDWCSRFGMTCELLKSRRISNQNEVVMAQIHQLREIYTDNPENCLNPDKDDYAEQAAEAITRVFSGKAYNGEDLKEPRQFLYDLERGRLKFIPREKPFNEIVYAENRDIERYWIGKLVMHRHLTPQETRDLLLLAQKGNPFAMDALTQAHAITVIDEAIKYAKSTSSGKTNDYIQEAFLILSRPILRYGFDKNKKNRDKTFFELHKIIPMFLKFIRTAIQSTIIRRAEDQKDDVVAKIWARDDAAFLAKTRAKVYGDINKVKTLKGLMGKRDKKNLDIKILQKIAKELGIQPRKVLELLIGCEENDLLEPAKNKLSKKLESLKCRFANEKSSSKTLDNLARLIDVANYENLNIETLVKQDKKIPFSPAKLKKEMEKIFIEIVKEKNKIWKKDKSRKFIARILSGKVLNIKNLSETVWWIERSMSKDLKDKNLEEVYMEYVDMLYKLVLKKPNPSNEDIAPVVYFITQFKPEHQKRLDSSAVRGIVSMQEPVGEEGDDSLGEIMDLGRFTGQETPEDEFMEQELLLNGTQFKQRREKILEVLDKLRERDSRKWKQELDELRPLWQEASSKLQKAQNELREIEERLEKSRSEKIRLLHPIIVKREALDSRHDEKILHFQGKQEREKRDLEDKQKNERKNGLQINGDEKLDHYRELVSAVCGQIGEKKKQIAKKYRETLREIEAREQSQSDEMIAKKEYEDRIIRCEQGLKKIELDLRIMRDREIEKSAQPAPEGMEGLHPGFPKDLDPKTMGSVKFDKDLWESILNAMDSAIPEDLLSRLKTIAGSTYNFHPTKLICAVLMPLCFDNRLWNFIDGNEDLGLRNINVRLNLIKNGQEPELDNFYVEGYGINEAAIFFEQILVLMKINDKYEKYLENQTKGTQPIVNIEEIKEKYKKEYEAKKTKIEKAKEKARLKYEQRLVQIKEEREKAKRAAEEEYRKALSVLEEEKEKGLSQAGQEHKAWKRYMKNGQLKGIHKKEWEELETKHNKEREELETEYREKSATTESAYNEAVNEFDRVIGEKLQELERDIRARESQISQERDVSLKDSQEIFKMKKELFTSEKYLTEWRNEQLILVKEIETEFQALNERYQFLERRERYWEKNKSMFLDRLGLSGSALKKGGELTLQEIANNPEYAKEDGTPIARERVRQIVKETYLQLLVFTDFDEVDLEDVSSYFADRKDFNDLLVRLKVISGKDTGEKEKGAETEEDEEKFEDAGKFYISRNELLRLLRTVIEAQEGKKKNDKSAIKINADCLNIIRLFIIKNHTISVDTYMIIAELAQHLIDAIEIDEEMLGNFEEKIGEMRIRLLLEGQIGSSEKDMKSAAKSHIRVTLSRLEKRFSPDYKPGDEFPDFPSTDKNWLSRDEIIKLRLTWRDNPDYRIQIERLLNKFIEEQDDMYPESDVEAVVKKLLEEADLIYRKRQMENLPNALPEQKRINDSAVVSSV